MFLFFKSTNNLHLIYLIYFILLEMCPFVQVDFLPQKQPRRGQRLSDVFLEVEKTLVFVSAQIREPLRAT